MSKAVLHLVAQGMNSGASGRRRDALETSSSGSSKLEAAEPQEKGEGGVPSLAMLSTVVSPASFVVQCRPAVCANEWEQCGGSSSCDVWTGPTCCAPGSQCVVKSKVRLRSILLHN